MAIMAFRPKCAKKRHLDRTYNWTSVYTGNNFVDVCVCLYGEKSTAHGNDHGRTRSFAYRHIYAVDALRVESH